MASRAPIYGAIQFVALEFQPLQTQDGLCDGNNGSMTMDW